MPSTTVAAGLSRPSLSICRSCARRLPSQQVRWVGVKYLEKKHKAEEAWQARALEIQNGERQNTWDLFNERGFVKDVTGRPGQVAELMRRRRIGAYVGIDPTAKSLHVGHLLPLMPIFWMYLHGYTAVTLLGGATARIGDPTDRLQTRAVLSNADVSMNVTKIHYQLKKLWVNVEAMGQKYGFQKEWSWQRHLFNNNMWWNSLPLYEVLKRLGRHIRIGPMLSRDTVKRKMEDGDGMSFAEFTYPLMQGWDWWHMYSQIGVQMQIGGSDQFGNILTGIETVKTVRESEEAPHLKLPGGFENDPVGFTVPLLTDSSGAKFGKSAGNAVWLDQFETSAFDLYGYFMRRSDEEVERLLKLFTFLPLPDIQNLMETHQKDPAKRVAQHTLAFEVLCLVHGDGVAIREQQQHRMLFGGASGETVGISSTTRPVEEGDTAQYEAIEGHPTVLNNAPRIEMQLPESLVKSSSLAKIVRAAGFTESASEANRLISGGGCYVAAAPGNQKRGLIPGNLDWTPLKMWFPGEVQRYLIDGRLLIMRRGKHNIRVIEVVSDEKWKQSGQKYLGEPGSGKVRQLMDELKRKAAEDGKELSNSELRKELDEALKDSEERVTVANNPDIEFPTKSEVRERRKAERTGTKLAGQVKQQLLRENWEADSRRNKGDKENKRWWDKTTP